MNQVRGTFIAHMQSCSTDPQAPLSSVHSEAMAHEWGDDSWTLQQQSIVAAHTQLDGPISGTPTWVAYLAAYDALHR